MLHLIIGKNSQNFVIYSHSSLHFLQHESVMEIYQALKNFKICALSVKTQHKYTKFHKEICTFQLMVKIMQGHDIALQEDGRFMISKYHCHRIIVV
jgi:hypothetical protein